MIKISRYSPYSFRRIRISSFDDEDSLTIAVNKKISQLKDNTTILAFNSKEYFEGGNRVIITIDILEPKEPSLYPQDETSDQ